jgi:hypothetical protein
MRHVGLDRAVADDEALGDLGVGYSWSQYPNLIFVEPEEGVFLRRPDSTTSMPMTADSEPDK